ncbi:hypothetical protein HYALB_00005560 [Hymenoscyphus albidus]|uniref:ORC6 first cyclin-like domain-containing protein n=1 Tax=Hymenoscyphus albidus TaxID=595503 RepID=A0A9N9PZF2_9HELO|nr:hypothetical protein HYALB_00005560 [Hymenoscyphus albidus]
MSRPIEQALNNLIPRHPGALPPELIELARSLLAQSRSIASTLKAEEEIGRTYACANIACERLKTTLDLPPIEPRPPIPPRAYAKLYGYFDRALTASRRKPRAENPVDRKSSGSSTPSKSLNRSSPASTPRKLPQKQTPSKATSLDPFRNHRAPKSGLRYASNADRDARIPKWLAPVVRKMCSELGSRKAIPHVLAGVETILCLPSSNLSEEDAARPQPGEKIPALVAAVWIIVVQHLNDQDTTKKEFKERRNNILGLYETIRDDEEVIVKVGGEGDELWNGWEASDAKSIQAWIMSITTRKWLEMDWFTNIEDGNENEVDLQMQTESDTSAGLGKRKIGTTMQDEYDYLSPENREQYQAWKEAMLATIDDLIAGGIMDMDVTED